MSNKSGISNNVISLPSGGGAMDGMGEKFSPDLFTGTGNFSVPIAVPQGRNGFQPQLTIGYSTGSGNSEFGMGWGLSVPGIMRKTNKGVPQYDDTKDVFILSGAEDLIEVNRTIDDTNAQKHTKVYYQPRTEGLFARIIHHYIKNDNGYYNYWEVRSKDGLISYYGHSDKTGDESAIVADPNGRDNIFCWKLSKTVDPFGNEIVYEYTRELIEEKMHDYDYLYLSAIKYIDYDDSGTTKYLASVSFEYEEKEDKHSDYKAGFETRCTQRCTAIKTHTHPKDVDLPSGYTASGENTILIKTYHFNYLDTLVSNGEKEANLLPINGCSMLANVQVEGFDSDTSEFLPPLEFTYTQFKPEKRDFFPLTGKGLPTASLGNPQIELADLDGNGLPDFVEMTGQSIRYWRNRGGGEFEMPRLMKEGPAGLALEDPDVQFMDADGDGRIDLMVNKAGLSGYYPLNHNGQWDKTFVRYDVSPSFSFADPEVKMMDLNGDGVTDVVRNGTRMECFFQDRDEGWSDQKTVNKSDLDGFPNISFADPRIKTANMTGDGMTDIVQISSGNMMYWPNMGHAKWGRKVQMRNAPKFPYNYNPAQIIIGDVDGDGLDDVIYFDSNSVTLWINQNGNSWSDPIEITGTPLVTDTDSVRLADVLGSGIQGVLFTFDKTQRRDNLFFMDFTKGTKPYMLSEMDNNMGAITKVGYTSSTTFYFEDDKKAETRWKTTLPFPTQVVECVEVVDAISENKLTTCYKYHHGYWDGGEREFRGFGRVDQMDTEESSRYHDLGLHGDTNFEVIPSGGFIPPLLTKSWFHLGPVGFEYGDWEEVDISHEYWSGDAQQLERPDDMKLAISQLPRRAKRDAYRTLRGSVLRTELYTLDGSERESKPYTVTEGLYGVRTEFTPSEGSALSPLGRVGEGQYIFFSYQLAQRTTQWERGNEPLHQFSFTEDFDVYGQAQKQISIAPPRAGSGDTHKATLSETEYIYVDQADGQYMVNRVARSIAAEIVNTGGSYPQALKDAVLEHVVHADFSWEETNNTAPATGALTKVVLFGTSHNYYDGNAYVGLNLGVIGDFGALVRSETLVIDNAQITAAYSSMPENFNSAPDWSAYPADFESNLQDSNHGYIEVSTASGDYIKEGYYCQSERKKYDFQEVGGTSVGLVTTIRDSFDNEASVTFDKYAFLPLTVTDAKNNVTTAVYNYRVLQAYIATDPNGNRSHFKFSPIGFLTESAVLGKEDGVEGDMKYEQSFTIDASTKLEYDFFAYMNEADPIWVQTTQKEHHAQDIEETEHSYEIEHIAGTGNGSNTNVDGDAFTVGEFYAPTEIDLSTDAQTIYVSQAHPQYVKKVENGQITSLGNALDTPCSLSVRIRGVAVDKYTDKVYFTGDGNKIYEITDFDNCGYTSIVDLNASPDYLEFGKTHIYVSFGGTNIIEKINKSTGILEKTWGTINTTGYQEGSDPLFSFTAGICLSHDEKTLYLADRDNQVIRAINLDTDETYLIAGTQNTIGITDGIGTDAKFNVPLDVAIDMEGKYLYVADRTARAIRRINLKDGNYTTATIAKDNVNGADLGRISSIKVGSDGNLYFCETSSSGVSSNKVKCLVVTESTPDTIVSKEYSDGFGRLVQTRTQAEDDIMGDTTYGDSGLPANSSATNENAVITTRTSGDLNVVVSGWQVYDNKGRVIEKYEPFFDTGFDYIPPSINQKGQKIKMYYDPRGQVVRTIYPDNREQRVIFGIPNDIAQPPLLAGPSPFGGVGGGFIPTPWETYTYDENDLAPITHPSDTSVLSHHHYTPSSQKIDALGRVVETTQRNYKDGAIEEILMSYEYDIRGNLLTVYDALERDISPFTGRIAFEHVYDYANQNLKTTHIDSGDKRVIYDCMGKPIELTDEKGALILNNYDTLNRPTHVWASDKTIDGTPEATTLRQFIIYGDDTTYGPTTPKDTNHLGQVYKQYDEAGLTEFVAYDFKGNLLTKKRQVIDDDSIIAAFPSSTPYADTAYRVDWSGLPVTEPSILATQEYQTDMEYDALNRVTKIIYPEDVDTERKELTPTYNKAGALEKVDFDGTEYVKHIAYNARGQRLLMACGNDMMTRYAYDPITFRLIRSKTEKYVLSSSPTTYAYDSGHTREDCTYEYDLIGNIIKRTDNRTNAGVAGADTLDSVYTYDAIYRLLSATGRENAKTASDPWDDTYRNEDANLTRGYTRNYVYDKLGNIQSQQHIATGGNFTKNFNYNASFNKLTDYTVGSDTYTYVHDVNGNITEEGSSRYFEWDYADRLKLFYVQANTEEPSIYAQYLYDGGGNRIKKIVRKTGGKLEVTIYIDGIFEHTYVKQDGINIDATRNYNTLHVMDNASRVAIIRVGNDADDSKPAIRYNIENHLGSSSVCLDATNGAEINREEYYPFGETSFGSYGKKRYRYVGKEKDEESGMYYYGARYYAPWICRFISVDPLAAKMPDMSSYAYAFNNPIMMNDPTGMEPSAGDGGEDPPSGGNTSDTGITDAGKTEEVGAQGVLHGTTYTVAGGDTLWSIGKRFGNSTDSLRSANKLKSNDIQIGQKLEISKSRSDNSLNEPYTKTSNTEGKTAVLAPNGKYYKFTSDNLSFTSSDGKTHDDQQKAKGVWTVTNSKGNYMWNNMENKFVKNTSDRTGGQNSYPGNDNPGTTYAGGDNPVNLITGKSDYSQPSQNIADYGGFIHDRDYDKLELVGSEGVMDPASTPANEKLIMWSSMVQLMYKEGKTDPFTGAPVSLKTYKAAKEMYEGFSAIEILKKK